MQYIKNPNYKKKAYFKTSKTEIEHLLKAWGAITLAFTIVLSPGLKGFIPNLGISAIIVATAFLLHELAHKFVAQHYRLYAEFRAQGNMLVFAIIMSFFGVIFAAPGAVMIRGAASKRQYGIISLAGPLTNLIIALVFLSLAQLNIGTGVLSNIIIYGFIINLWIAIFNMIPVWNFDGAKVIRWSKGAYFATLIPMIIMFSQIF